MTASVIFPSRMFEPRVTEDNFASQCAAAKQAGLPTYLLDQEALDAGDFMRAVRLVPAGVGAAVYRGWMLTVDAYGQLFETLQRRGVELINDPAAYTHCHLLPESFDVIRSMSPHTIWVPLDKGMVDIDEVVARSRVFGSTPVIVKDYVKSRKHEWYEACFVPSAADEAALRRVIGTFVERQGALLTGGVIVRKSLELEAAGVHPKSGMPLTREHRIFVLDGAPLAWGRYWADGRYDHEELPFDELSSIMRQVRSRFFTMDIARGADGAWHIIELGDGQVAGLLDTIDGVELFKRLAERLPG